MIVLTPFSFTASRGKYITTYNGEMIATLKPYKSGKPPSEKALKKGSLFLDRDSCFVIDPWVSSQPMSTIHEGAAKLRAYLDAGGHPSDSFKR